MAKSFDMKIEAADGLTPECSESKYCNISHYSHRLHCDSEHGYCNGVRSSREEVKIQELVIKEGRKK